MAIQFRDREYLSPAHEAALYALVLRCRYLHMVRRVFPPEDAAGFARSRRRYLRLAWALFALQAAVMTATRVAAAKCW